MSDFDSEELYETEEPRGLRKQIEEQASARKQAEEKAAALERELAFAKAGLPLDDPKIAYFVKGYDGSPSPEAIRAAAEAAGFIGEPAQPEVPAEELAQHQQVAALAAAGTASPPDENAEYLAALGMAKTKEEIFAVMDRYGSARTSNIF